MEIIKAFVCMILFTTLTSCATKSKQANELNTMEIKQLLKYSTNYFAKQFIQSQEAVVELMPSKRLKQNYLYRCVNLESGSEGTGDFWLAVRVSTSPQEALILTGSTENLNKLLKSEGLLNSTNLAVLLEVVMESFEMVRPLHKSFDILVDRQMCDETVKLVAAINKKTSNHKITEPSITMIHDHNYLGEIWFMSGRDLYQRTFGINEAGLSWQDRLCESNVRMPTNPHE